MAAAHSADCLCKRALRHARLHKELPRGLALFHVEIPIKVNGTSRHVEITLRVADDAGRPFLAGNGITRFYFGEFYFGELSLFAVIAPTCSGGTEYRVQLGDLPPSIHTSPYPFITFITKNKRGVTMTKEFVALIGKQPVDRRARVRWTAAERAFLLCFLLCMRTCALPTLPEEIHLIVLGFLNVSDLLPIKI